MPYCFLEDFKSLQHKEVSCPKEESPETKYKKYIAYFINPPLSKCQKFLSSKENLVT